MGWDKSELLVWRHRMNHCTFKSILRIPKRKIIPKNLRKIIKLPLLLPEYLESNKRGHVVPKANT